MLCVVFLSNQLKFALLFPFPLHLVSAHVSYLISLCPASSPCLASPLLALVSSSVFFFCLISLCLLSSPVCLLLCFPSPLVAFSSPCCMCPFLSWFSVFCACLLSPFLASCLCSTNSQMHLLLLKNTEPAQTISLPKPNLASKASHGQNVVQGPILTIVTNRSWGSCSERDAV